MDNRMGWILAMEEVEKVEDKDTYFIDHEICSEVRIPGVLDYGNGSLMCALFQEEDKNGLFTYAIRLKHVYKEYKFDESKYSKNGYYFKDGLIGELMAIFSVYFQARFYLKATVSGELTSKSVRSRYENDFRYVRPNPYRNFEMFTAYQKRNWANEDGLKAFLDRMRSIDQEYHQNLTHAFFWYAEAIKEIGLDSQMFFIKMVSAVEALLKLLPKSADALDKKLTKLYKEKKFEPTEVQEINNWLENRKIRHRFILFFEKYAIGFCKGGKRKPAHGYIQKEDVNDYAGKIYDARSAYLHSGKPMYLSQDMAMENAKCWDLDGSSGMMADRKKFDDKEKLPRTRWFERIVNHCLKKICATLAANDPKRKSPAHHS
ncbi:MAG: hypothetical protein AAB588_03170 [Patescibacteria group bacterium]